MRKAITMGVKRLNKVIKTDNNFNTELLSIDELKYLNELFMREIKHRELIFVGHSEYSDFKKYQLSALRNSDYRLFEYNSKYDLVFTPNTFKNAKQVNVLDNDNNALISYNGKYINTFEQTRHKHNLFDISALALDIDFRKVWLNDKAKALDFFNDILLEPMMRVLPYPSYIEYGHNIRLIWVLRERVELTKIKDTTKRNSVIKAIETTLKKFCEMLNNEENVGAEFQPINSFFRVPKSINTKDGSTVNVIAFNSIRYTWQELMEYLPTLKPKRKNQTTVISKRKHQVAFFNNRFTLLNSRVELLEENVKSINKNSRYNACYVLAVCLIQMDKYSLDRILKFNSLLKEPLKEKELESKLRTITSNKFINYVHWTNQELETMLGTEGVFSMTKREREKLEKIKNGTTRKQIADSNYSKVKELYLSGKKRNEIAELVNLSPITVRNMITKIRKEIKNND